MSPRVLSPRRARLFLFVALVLLDLAARTAQAQPPPPSTEGTGASRFVTGLEGRAARRPGASERVHLNLEDGDLMDLVRLMTSITGQRYVVTGSPRALRATVASAEPVTVEEARLAFLAILHQNGLTVVRRGRHHLIVDAGNIARRPTEVFDDRHPPPPDDRFVTWIHAVSHVPVAEAAALLEPLRSTDGQILTHAATNSLVLVDTGANITRMRRILRDVDVASGDVHLWVEPLRFADATQVAEQVRAVFLEGEGDTPAPRARPETPAGRRSEPAASPSPASSASSPRAAALRRVLPEPRTNALIVVATEAGYRRVLALLREIDRPDEETTVEVVRLQHADAANVAATLSRLLGGTETQASARSSARVEPHADLNALVITSSPAEQRRMRRLVAELDTPPRQVFLEMVLMELSVDRGQALGVNVLSGLTGILDPSTVGLIAAGGGGADAADLLTGLAIGISGPLVTDARLPGGSAPSFGAMLHALSRSSQADILSTPHVLVLDNRQATINVGQNVPLQGSSVPGLPSLIPGATSASADATALTAMMSANAGRRDTGTIVRVTPHINDDGEIRLEIEAEDSRTGDVAEGNLGAVALHQSIAQTVLVVGDGQTAVIGGLMRDSTETRRSGVPVLSDLPVLGALFGQTQQRTVRRNLLFFVTPYIVRSHADLRRIFERRMRERREMAERQIVFEGSWEPRVDYSRTRGLLAEILDRVEALDREEAEELAARAERPSGHPARPPIDLEGTQIEIGVQLEVGAEP